MLQDTERKREKNPANKIHSEREIKNCGIAVGLVVIIPYFQIYFNPPFIQEALYQTFCPLHHPDRANVRLPAKPLPKYESN